MTTLLPTVVILVAIGSDTPPVLSAVKEAWNARSRAVRNGEFQWISTIDNRVPMNPRHIERAIYPLKETVTLRVDGERRFYRRVGEQRSENGREIVPLDITEAFSSKEYRVRGIKLPGQKHHFGSIAATDEGRDNPQPNPILWLLSYRKINFDQLAVVELDVDCRGRKTVLLREVQDRKDWLYWMDPSENFSIRRAVSYRKDGSCSMQFDINYLADKQGVAIPSSWEMTWLATGGRLMKHTASQMKSHSLNRTFSDDDFEIRFPNGTYVHDLRPGKKPYIVEEVVE